MTHHHHSATDHEDQAGHDPQAAMAELLDLDAEVLPGYLAEVTAWVKQWAAPDPRRIVDLGAGTGTGTIALAQRFEAADILALDASDGLLSHLRAKTQQLDLAHRVHLIRADLDVTWPDFEPVDIAWASLSLHHLADPDAGLRTIAARLRPDGVLVVLEIEAQPRFLPADIGIGRPGLEERCQALVAVDHATSVPELGSDWHSRFGPAGLTIMDERRFVLEAPPSSSGLAGRYAQAYLSRIRSAVADRLDPEDLVVLDALLDVHGPHSLLDRHDLVIRGSRIGWIVGVK